jgi:hypothetical protein
MFFSKPLRLIKLARILLVLVLALFISFADVLPAQAAIRTFEESPGQVLRQSRTTLKDEFGNRWQAITFKRSKPDGSEVVGLRLVGFPGAVTIDRSRPLMLKDSLGNTLTAADASAPIFTDADNPEPHIGQYDLQPVLDDLRPELPLELQLPVIDGDPVVLQIAPQTVQEWKQVATS